MPKIAAMPGSARWKATIEGGRSIADSKRRKRWTNTGRIAQKPGKKATLQRNISNERNAWLRWPKR